MQVSKRTLSGLAIAAAVVGLAWFLRGTRSGQEVQAWRVDRQARAAETALVDSARRLGRVVRTEQVWLMADSALRTTDAAVVVVGSGASSAIQATESLLRLVPEAPEPRVPTRFVLFERAAITDPLTGLPWAFAKLPAPDLAGPCVAVRVVFPRDSIVSRWDRDHFRQSPWEGAIGPCWYLARFGPPGPQIRRWLDARYWDVAAAIPPLGLQPFVEEGHSGGWFDAVLLGELDRLSAELSLREGCPFGQPLKCEARLLGSPYRAGTMPANVVGGLGVGPSFSFRSSNGPSLLALMLQELGPERFRLFWQSDRPVLEAFQQATGASLGEWYIAQMRRQLQVAGYPVPPGDPSWPAVLGILALALAGIAWHAERRQVR